MEPLGVMTFEIIPQSGLRVIAAIVRAKVHIVVLDCGPQALDEHVVRSEGLCCVANLAISTPVRPILPTV